MKASSIETRVVNPKEKTTTTTSNNNNVTKTSEDPALPFVTTSGVVNKLNHYLGELHYNQGDSEQDESNKKKQGYFELQKQLPNGHTRRATKEELESADMDQKLKQAAEYVAHTLTTNKERIEWANQQRYYGNKLYQDKNYKQAIDIYLTCLVAVQYDDSTPTSLKPSPLFLTVMNNLAQCTLQLSWYHKTEHFCTIALKEYHDKNNTSNDSNDENDNNDDDNSTSQQQDDYPQQEEPKQPQLEQKEEEQQQQQQSIIEQKQQQQQAIAKLYFKRGKARRLRGHYKTSRIDLNQSKSILSKVVSVASSNDEDDNTDNNNNKNTLSTPELRAIERELQLLSRAEQEGQKNKQRQQKAMKNLLSTNNNTSATTTSSNSSNDNYQAPSQLPATTNTSTQRLYNEPQKRTYSTLRARRHQPTHDEKDKQQQRDKNPTTKNLDIVSLTQAYWHMYRLKLAHVAQQILDWMGDDDEEEEEQQKQQQHHEDPSYNNDRQNNDDYENDDKNKQD